MIGVPVQNHNRLSHRPLIHRKFSRGKGSVWCKWKKIIALKLDGFPAKFYQTLFWNY
jgi:hypothetical protein